MLAITKASADQLTPIDSSPSSKEIADFPSLDITPSPLAIVLGDSYQDISDANKAATQAQAARIAPKPILYPSQTKTALTTDSMTNSFAPGNCTAYVADHFPVTWLGNASAWAGVAASQGYVVDRTPEAGSIIVTTENSKYCPGCGHVVYVDSIDQDGIHISEMNFVRKYVVDHRTFAPGSPLIKAVIHRK